MSKTKVPEVTGMRVRPEDAAAIRAIIDAGFAHSPTTAIRFALQRATRWISERAA